MSDVLEGGRPGGPRRSVPPGLRRAVFGLAALVVIGGLAVLIARHGSPGNSAKPQPSSPPSSSSVPTERADGGVVGVTAAPWPAASGACGSTVFLPIGEFAPQLPTQYAATNGSFLVGGAQIWPLRISATTGISTPSPVPGLPAGTAAMVDDFAKSPDGEYALVSSCEDPTSSVVYRLSNQAAVRLDARGVIDLIGGVHHTWAVSEATDATSASVPSVQSPEQITPLSGGRSLVLNPHDYLVADVTAGLIVATSGTVDDEAPPTLAILDPATGGVEKTLTAAFPVASQGNTLLVEAAQCSVDSICTLLRVDLTTGKVTARDSLPKGRVPASGAVFSADTRLVALQLTQGNPDRRFSVGHPFPPSGVAVLDLDTGQLRDISNLELAPKTSVGLVFDETASSLFMAVDQGERSDVLVWQAGMAAPAFVTSLPGAVAGPVPMLARS